MSEGLKDEVVTGSGSGTGSGAISGAVADIAENVDTSLFAMLDAKTRARLVVFSYVSGVGLGCYLAITAFQFELSYYLAHAHWAGDMPEFMYTLIFLPLVGGAWNTIKPFLSRKRLCTTCKDEVK